MALSKLSGDEQGILFVQLCNVLDPGIAVALASVSNELRAATHAPLQELKTGHEAAAALCPKLGHRNCKALREAKQVLCCNKGLTADELKLLGTLGSVLPALETLYLCEPAAGPDGGRQLAAGLRAGALPAVTCLCIFGTHVGDAGASALAAALGQGALPRLQHLTLGSAAIGDAGLVALAPALRRRPALEWLSLGVNPLGDEGLAALVAPPPPAGAPPPTTGGLAQLKVLGLQPHPDHRRRLRHPRRCARQRRDAGASRPLPAGYPCKRHCQRGRAQATASSSTTESPPLSGLLRSAACNNSYNPANAISPLLSLPANKCPSPGVTTRSNSAL